MTLSHRSAKLLAVGAALCALAPARPCAAQSLRGSRASVNRMYHEAHAEHLHFYETSHGVYNAVKHGDLVRLVPGDDFTLHNVGYPFVRATTRTFVERLGAEYQAACGDVLEVTSAVRPEDRQPPGSVPQSVHPAGIAVDLHKPQVPKCRSWLRSTLLELEDAGLIEATEEYAPPHFHVAVYPTPYRQYVRAHTHATQGVQLASAGSVDDSTTYHVRRGDTLWDIARDHDTTVKAIASANNLDNSTIQPGQELIIPAGS